MVEPMDPLPTSADDPRLQGWYHTIELAPGVITRAVWDHRSSIHQVGLPSSLAGKTALDVGTADGFWAFEMERRGADRVVAIDVARAGDVDLLPRHRARCSEDELNSQVWPQRFATAHMMLGSRVEYRFCNVYDLSPATFGAFDVVYCGSLLLHLFNPLQALINIRAVTKEVAVIETAAYHPDRIEKKFPDRPIVWFGRIDWEGDRPGCEVGYWSFTVRALCDMLIYAGFDWVEPLDSFPMGKADGSASLTVTPVIAYATAPDPDALGVRKSRLRGHRPHYARPSPWRLRSLWHRLRIN